MKWKAKFRSFQFDFKERVEPVKEMFHPPQYICTQFQCGPETVKTLAIRQWKYSAAPALTGFERIDSNFKRISTAGKKLSDSITCYREMIPERKSQSM